MKGRDVIVLRFPVRDSRNRVSFGTLQRLAAVWRLSPEDTIHRELAEFARNILNNKRPPAPRFRKKATRRR